MNWQFRLFLTGVILSISITSCKKKENDNIKLQPEETVGALYIDDFEVEAYNVQKDSTVSSHGLINKHLAGTFNDPIFGKVNAATFTQIKIPEDGFDIPSQATLLSANLVLSPNYYIGKENEDIKLLIYTLNEPLNEKNGQNAAVYYTFSNLKLGNFLQEITINEVDNTKNIPLNTSFLNLILNLKNKINNQTDLNNILNGITFQPSNGNGILGFDFSETFIKLEFENTLSNNTKDTITKIFLLSDGIAHFNRITSNKSGSTFENVNINNKLISSASTNNQMMIQAGSRVEGQLNFTDFNDKFYNTKELIYRAVLDLTIEKPDFKEFSENNIVILQIYDVNNVLIHEQELPIIGKKLVYNITDVIQNSISGKYKIGFYKINSSQRGHRVHTFWVNNPKENCKLKIYFNQQ